MATNGAPEGPAASGLSATPRSALWSFMLEHRGATVVATALILVLIATTVVTAFVGTKEGALNDATTCSEWAAATSSQQLAYSHLYINEYTSTPNTAFYADAVRTAINKDCVQAAYLGEADDVSVLAAIRHAF